MKQPVTRIKMRIYEAQAKMKVCDHCIIRISERCGIPFDYSGIYEQVIILMSGIPNGYVAVRTLEGTLIVENRTAITWLDPDQKPKRGATSGRRTENGRFQHASPPSQKRNRNER